MSTLVAYSDAEDWYLYQQQFSWANARNLSSGAAWDTTSSVTYASSYQSWIYWFNIRSFFVFDTSGITWTVNSWELDITLIEGTGNLSWDICLVESTQAAKALVLWDYDQRWTTEFAGRVTIPSTSGVETFTLNASWLASIDDAWDTEFCIITDLDFDDTAPATWSVATDADITTAEATGTTDDPTLTIIYGVAASTTWQNMFFAF